MWSWIKGELIWLFPFTFVRTRVSKCCKPCSLSDFTSPWERTETPVVSHNFPVSLLPEHIGRHTQESYESDAWWRVQVKLEDLGVEKVSRGQCEGGGSWTFPVEEKKRRVNCVCRRNKNCVKSLKLCTRFKVWTPWCLTCKNDWFVLKEKTFILF